ncbi:MAG: hypothetical protein ABSF46_24235 [Terriglobia bacterium]|jgi:hypothetical protein
MSVLPGQRSVRAAIICCLLVLQGNLLWLATFHQHPFEEFAGGTSPAIHQRNLQPRPALASELSCGLCQMVRHSLALPVTGLPVFYAEPLVSRLLVFRVGDYYSRQSIVLYGRAPPLS